MSRAVTERGAVLCNFLPYPQYLLTPLLEAFTTRGYILGYETRRAGADGIGDAPSYMARGSEIVGAQGADGAKPPAKFSLILRSAWSSGMGIWSGNGIPLIFRMCAWKSRLLGAAHWRIGAGGRAQLTCSSCRRSLTCCSLSSHQQIRRTSREA